MDFGWFGDRDTLPTIQWLVDSPDVGIDRLALVGMSRMAVARWEN
jgi:hypothetical protein